MHFLADVICKLGARDETSPMRCEIRARFDACRLSVTAPRQQHHADTDLPLRSNLLRIDYSLKCLGGSEKSLLCCVIAGCLSTESVEGSSLAFQGVDNVESGDSLSLGMLSVGDGITDDVFQEDLEDTSGFFVDQAGDTLDTTSASQPSDGGLGDTLDVITKNFSVPLGASFSQSFSSLSAS